MKILLLSDLHAHPFRYGSRDNGRDRANDTISCLRQSVDLAHQRAIQTVLFGGDLLHIKGRVDTVTFNGVYDELERAKGLGIRVIMIPGNHDQADHLGQQHAARSLRHVSEVVSDTRVLDVGDVEIACVPWEEGGRAGFMEDAYSACEGFSGLGAKLLLGHVDVAGALTGSDFVFPGQDCPAIDDLMQLRQDHGLSAVFLGHFHMHQQLAPATWYVGAPLQHNWGDIGQDRGVVIWDSLQPNVIERVELQAPRFVRGHLDRLDEVRAAGNFVRLESPEALSPAERQKLFERIEARGLEVVPEAKEAPTLVTVPVSLDGLQSMESRIAAWAGREPARAARLQELGLSLYRQALSEVEA